MLNIKNTKSMLLVALLSTFLLGCGESTTTSSTSFNGQLADSYVKGASYSCFDAKIALTGSNGEFQCEKLPVEFFLHGIKLGEMKSLPLDKHIFPQDLVGVERSEINNTKVIAMAQLLQSLDSDANASNGIDINLSSIEKITYTEDFNLNNLDNYLGDAEVVKVETIEAISHLEQTTLTVASINSAELPDTVVASLSTALNVLSDTVKNNLAYMGNEERLAYDIYNKLFTLFPAQKQFYNIASKSEIKHIATVKALVTKYDINATELSITDVNVVGIAGVYNIQKIQDLYNVLLSKGEQTNIDALQVACMVEVTDIDDLDKYLVDAEESNASDIVSAFEFLRDGSYNHYWAFDRGLKNIGVIDGCCSVGEEWCKTELEYPKKN